MPTTCGMLYQTNWNSHLLNIMWSDIYMLCKLISVRHKGRNYYHHLSSTKASSNISTILLQEAEELTFDVWIQSFIQYYIIVISFPYFAKLLQLIEARSTLSSKSPFWALSTPHFPTFFIISISLISLPRILRILSSSDWGS